MTTATGPTLECLEIADLLFNTPSDSESNALPIIHLAINATGNLFDSFPVEDHRMR